jgi:hypothetical protein
MPELNDLPTCTAYLRWELLEAGADGQSLILRYLAAHRGRGPARVLVRESARTIAITVEQSVLEEGVDLRGSGVAVTGARRVPIKEVALEAPIGGRRLEGEGMSEGALRSLGYPTRPGPGTLLIPVVPRVVGLACSDAVCVLGRQGFPAMVIGEGSTVLEQRPERGGVARNTQANTYDVGEPIALVCG